MNRLLFSMIFVSCYQASPIELPSTGLQAGGPFCATVDVIDHIHNVVNFASQEIECIDLINTGDVGQLVDFFTLDASSLTSCDAQGNCETPYSCEEISTSLVLEDLNSGEEISVGASTGFHGCSFREMPFQPGRELRVWHFAEDAITSELGYRVLIFVR